MQKPFQHLKLARNTRFIYDGWNVVEERRVRNGSAGVVVRNFVWGEDLSGSLQDAGGVGGLVASLEKTITGAWTPFYYHYDGNGNVTNVTNSTKSSVAKFTYDGFGRTVTQTGSKAGIDINALNYRFSTKPMELELATSNTTLVPPPVSSGLYYYGYRFYSPNLGRWISRDPIREQGGRNLYNFVGNDGVDKWDKLGLMSSIRLCSRICRFTGFAVYEIEKDADYVSGFTKYTFICKCQQKCESRYSDGSVRILIKYIEEYRKEFTNDADGFILGDGLVQSYVNSQEENSLNYLGAVIGSNYGGRNRAQEIADAVRRDAEALEKRIQDCKKACQDKK